MSDLAARSSSTPLYASNGEYGVVLTPAGTGFAVYGDYLLTSWEDDPVEDDLGITIYLRDRGTGAVWTASGAALAGADPGTLTATIDSAELVRSHDGIESRLSVSVAANEPVERRRLILRNLGATAREIEVTACVEPVLNDAGAHSGHPGFSKLFVQTRWDAEASFLVATRRPRSNGERHPAMAFGFSCAATLEWETDRACFLGRGRRPADALAIATPGALSGTVGNVLDPVLAVRTAICLEPRATIEIGCILAVADEPAGLAARFHGTCPAAPVVEIAGEEGVESDLATPLARRLLRSWSAGSKGPAGGVAPVRPVAPKGAEPGPAPEALVLGNGYGGFSADGREYVIRLRREAGGRLRLPPMPWTNVIANERFGCYASEKGAGTTWSRNSRLNRITPWRNDPIRDPHDDAVYVRDQASGEFWSALPGPAPGADAYEVRHGFGYSRWSHVSRGLGHEVCLFVPRDEPLRILEVTLRNPSAAPRRVAVYSYNRWVLGISTARTSAAVSVRFDAARRAVLAENPGAGLFAGAIAFTAFAGVGDAEVTASTDRAAFLGRPGSTESPAALSAGGAFATCHASADPCAIIRVELDLPAGGDCALRILLGEAMSTGELDGLLEKYRTPGAAAAALAAVERFWADCVGRTQVTTPVPAIDLMANGWLLYQTLACRLWARTALYQSGGAFGFRDQLQDAAAFALSQPAYLRTQLLENAAQQFTEGDVLHWWHPPDGHGIRTRFADDLVWLPYMTAYYVRVTGDEAILSESVGFLTGPELGADEDEESLAPRRAVETADLYSHCVRALGRAMTRGAHGLPLFGSGDWNDGMNRVGREGRGESVWMGFFLYATIGDFLPICQARGDAALAMHLTGYRDAVGVALNAGGWDGEWYRRGYYDNGTPLGSRCSDECQVDALAQAWAVISKAAPEARATLALDAVERRLISTRDGLIRLLTPPFVNTPQDPGYIKGYVAGVRENGGQYTHAALWVVRAILEAGRRDRGALLLEMLSPISRNRAAEERYQVEPYVIAADVYGVAPHVGRGGWTWYTGSAGWMYRVTLESLLGFSIEGGNVVTLAPRIPDEWPGFTLSHQRADGTWYRFVVSNPDRRAEGVVAVRLDGQPLAVDGGAIRIPLNDDGRRHEVEVTLGPRALER